MTALTFFIPTLRVLLQDFDPSVQQYADTSLINGLKTALLMNRLPGFGVSLDGTSVTPDIVGPGADPNNFALLVYHTVRYFVLGNPERYSYKTRAVSESFGHTRQFLNSVELDIWQLENGSLITSWQSYHSWVAGCAGLPLGLVLTNVNVAAPFFTANVSTAGVTIAPSSPSVTS